MRDDNILIELIETFIKKSQEHDLKSLIEFKNK